MEMMYGMCAPCTFKQLAGIFIVKVKQMCK